MVLTPVNEPVSLDKLAYDAIKEAILSFKLLPGQSLVENDLANQLKISKTPVRSALLQLEKEGLVVKLPYRGTFVSELSPKVMAELFQIRSALEGLVARQVVENATDEKLEALRLTLHREIEALKGNHIAEATHSNVSFHEMLIASSTSDWLKRLLANLDDHLRRYRLLSYNQKGRLDRSIQEHQKILDALIARDADQAESAMREHLTKVMDDLSREDFEALIGRGEEIAAQN